jgi:hypothetical protein
MGEGSAKGATDAVEPIGAGTEPSLDWVEIKNLVVAWTDLERDALHIYAASLVQLAAALVLRRSVASLLPWIAALLLAVANEAADTLADGVLEGWERQGALHDLWNSMLLPTMLLLTARYAPRILVRPPLACAPVAEEAELGPPSS